MDVQRNTLTEEYKKAVQEASKVVKAGGIILYPTDTIWGLGCDATNEEAVQRIFTLKGRAESKAMLLLIDSDAKLPGLVREVPDIAYQLIDAGGRNVASSLIAPEGTLGIRITHEAFSRALCAAVRVPLVSTSANLSGQPAPKIFAEISEEIKAAVDYVVPVRQDECTPARPSEIISIGLGGEVKILRS